MKNKTAPSSRLKFWGIALPITLGLFYPTYMTWTAVSTAQHQLTEATTEEERLREERDKWAGLDAQQAQLRSQVAKEKQAVVAGMKSFSRDELHDALKRAVEADSPDQGIVLPLGGVLWGNRAWVWVPVGGHHLTVQIEATNLTKEDIVGKDVEIDRDLKLELKPRELHLVEFELEERRKPKDCVMRLRFNDRAIFEQQLLLDPNKSTSHGGGSGDFFVRPGITQGTSVWNDSPEDLFERRIWHWVEREEFGLRPREGADAETVEIVCKIGIASDGPTYARKVMQFAFERKGIETKEVQDPESPFNGMLQITGVKPKENKGKSDGKSP